MYTYCPYSLYRYSSDCMTVGRLTERVIVYKLYNEQGKYACGRADLIGYNYYNDARTLIINKTMITVFKVSNIRSNKSTGANNIAAGETTPAKS